MFVTTILHRGSETNFKEQVSFGRRPDQFITCQILHRRIKLVVGAVRAAIEERFVIGIPVFSTVGNENPLCRENLGWNRSWRSGLACKNYLCGKNRKDRESNYFEVDRSEERRVGKEGR